MPPHLCPAEEGFLNLWHDPQQRRHAQYLYLQLRELIVGQQIANGRPDNNGLNAIQIENQHHRFQIGARDTRFRCVLTQVPDLRYKLDYPQGQVAVVALFGHHINHIRLCLYDPLGDHLQDMHRYAQDHVPFMYHEGHHRIYIDLPLDQAIMDAVRAGITFAKEIWGVEQPHLKVKEPGPDWDVMLEGIGLPPDLLGSVKDDIARTTAQGTEGEAPLSSAGQPGNFNRIPSDIRGDCRPLLVAYCFAADSFDLRLKEVIDHAAKSCPQTEHIMLVTSQWNPASWKNHHRTHFEDLKQKDVTIVILLEAFDRWTCVIW